MRFAYYAHFERISDCEGWIATTLERQGHYVLRVQRKFPQVPIFPVDQTIDALRAGEADFLLLSKVPEATADDLRMIKAAGFKIAFWTFDWMRDPANWRWYAPLAQVADICFQTDGWGESEYELAGIRRVELHQGAFPDIHHPVVPTAAEREKYGADVAFCGSLYTARRHELVRELRRYNFKLWGPSTEELWGRGFAAMVACTKIVVCDNYVNHVPGYWSDRIYLTLACGGFVAAAFVQGMERVFNNGEDMIWWHDFKDMHDRIETFLKRDEHRLAIAATGHVETIAEHVYEQRVKAMIAHLEAL